MGREHLNVCVTTGTGTPVTTTNTFNAGDELTKSVTGTTSTTMTYDADGRQTASGSTTYAWNAANELKSIIKAGVTTTYAYDGDANRVSSITGSAKTTEVWDINGNLPALATVTTAAGNQNYLWDIGALGFTTSSGTFYDLHDDQGSVVGVVSSAGVLQSTASYGPFGNTIASTTLVGSAPSQQIGWQGQALDASGRYDLRAREYDPSTQRFLSTDPLVQPVSSLAYSAYLYANDEPTALWDPSGESFLGDIGQEALSVVPGVAGAFVGVYQTVSDVVSTCSESWSSVNCGKAIQRVGVAAIGAVTCGVLFTTGVGAPICALVAWGVNEIVDNTWLANVSGPSGATSSSDRPQK